jgi:molecular chaperone Hsp33
MSEEMVDEWVVVESIFVRHRNCHLLRAHFSPLFVDYYLHLMRYGLRNENIHDSLLKGALAYFTLYLVARPWAEQHAWTINLKSPVPANIFVTGSSLTESVVGRVFTEDVKVPEQNTMYAQLYKEGAKVSSSVVPVVGDQPSQWVEEFFHQSEQRLARCFELPDEYFHLITAQPDADEEWLKQLTAEQMATIDQDEEVKVLETRRFKFNCGCTLDRILPTLQAMKNQIDDLFGDDESIQITCPRCGALYQVTRKQVEGE